MTHSNRTKTGNVPFSSIPRAGDKVADGLTRRGILVGGALALAAKPATALSISPNPSGPAAGLMNNSYVIDMLGLLDLGVADASWARKISDEEAKTFHASGVTALHHAFGFGDLDAYAETLEFFAAWNSFIARNNDHFTLVCSAEDIVSAKKSGKVAVILGSQNSSHFRTTKDVSHFWNLGQRCSQLTYNEQNLIGSGVTERVDGGLSDYGVSIVKQMNKIGMLVDVSHCGDRTTLDAIESSNGPIAITHANCRAIVDHPRAKTDEAIKALADKGGVIGIAGVRNFVRDREPTTIEHYVDHIDHVARLTSIDHVGVGSDADLYGYDSLPAEILQYLRSGYKSSYAFREKLDTDGFGNPQKYYALSDALLRRGYSSDQVAKILGGNFLRLLEIVWAANSTYESDDADNQ